MVLLSVTERHRVIRKAALCSCLLLGAAMAATGQTRQENLNECASVEPGTRIAGCTALIKAGQDTTGDLSTIYNNRGTAYSSKGDHDHAIQDFTEAIRLNPNYAYTYRNRGIDYHEKGDYDRAIRDYNEAIRLNPNYTSVYALRGDTYNGKGDYDRAIQDLNEAIRLDPNYVRAYDDRGLAYSRKGDYDRAIQNFSEAIRLNANDASSYYSRGSAYYNKGDYDHAIQDYNEAIRLNPNFTLAYEKRGDTYFVQSNLTAAITNFEHAISAAPSSTTAIFAALMLHVAMRRQGHDDVQQLAPVAAAADLSKWPGPVLKLDLGQMTASEVMAAAQADANMQKWQVCEANYFTGEDALLHHQQATALAHLKAARDGCPKGDTDYRAALAELNRLGASAHPSR
jgi:tetratricopeptide (TPR) repeat protein